MRAMLGAIAIGLAVGVAGCSPFSAGAFTCTDDSQCDFGGGVCEPNGFCSIADGACDSGRRYAERSGGLSGVCVGDEGVDAGVGDDAAGNGDWFDPAFAFRREISFQFTPTTEDLTGFPVLLRFDASNGNYDQILDAGEDIRFTTLENTLVPHEIERWNEAGTSAVWVKFDIATSGNSRYYMYWGNAGASDGQQATDVWSEDFLAVLHLDEDVTDEQTTAAAHADSTGNGNSGDQSGNARGEIAGSIAGAADFDGADDFIEIDQAGLQVTNDQITITARALVRTEPNTFPHIWGGGADGRYWQSFWREATDDWTARYRVDGGAEDADSPNGTLNVWVTIVGRYDGAAVTQFLDGVADGTANATGNLDALDTPLRLGDNPVLSPRELDGMVDEFRISTVARSDEWIAASHLSLTDALVTLGAPEMFGN